MRIVHLMTSMNPGGVTTFVNNLLPGLREHGVDSEIVITKTRGLVAGEMVEAGFPIHECYDHGGIEIAWSYRVGKQLRKLARSTWGLRLQHTLRKLKPDIVHSHMHGESWTTQLAAAHSAGAPLLLTLHSPSSPYPDLWRARALFVRWLGPGDKLVAVAPSIYKAHQDFFRILPERNVHHPGEGIPYGLPDPGLRDWRVNDAIRQELRIPQDALVVGSVGRLIRHKRVGDLISAVGKLHKAGDNVHLLLVGDGSAREELEHQVISQGLESWVHFVGFQTNPAKWLNAMDLCGLVSLFEGLPVAILEAMAAGIPAVGSDVRGTKDLVEDGETGILVPLGDVEGIAGALSRLVENTDLRHQMGQRARAKFLTRYQIEYSVSSYVNLYETMTEDTSA